MIQAFKLMSILCCLAEQATSLRIVDEQLPVLEKLDRGTGLNGETMTVMPWALRPGETSSDFVHTLSGANPELYDDSLPQTMNTSKSQNGVGYYAPGEKPKTAILLVGLLRDWPTHIDEFLSGMVHPNDADVFIHSKEPDEELVQKFGSILKGHASNAAEHWLAEGWHSQFWHFEEAWKLMSSYEQSNNFKYDVVVRARSDVAPVAPSWLNMAEWRDEGRIHMMTDMMFWGRRDDMAKIASMYTEAGAYYKKHQDPMRRPIPVEKLLDSILRDPFTNRETNSKWHLYQKLGTLPYPDMGEKGAIANLQKAVAKGMNFASFEGDETCLVSHGDIYNSQDYRYGILACEKDILHWVLIHNLTICDLSPDMGHLRWKNKLVQRHLASDCSIKPVPSVFHTRDLEST